MKSRLLPIIGISIGVILALFVLAWAGNTYYRINNGASATVDENDLCRVVTNNNGRDIFVPTKTVAEWQAFRANPPSGVSLSACQSNPSSLGLSHTSNNKQFTVSWTAGTGNGGAGGCKLQFFASGSTWTDITSANSVNCDANTNTAYTLNGDGWKSNWGGTQVRLVRKSDSAVMGTFGTTLSCSWTSGSETPTPTIDEDCNGYWDNDEGYEGEIGGCEPSDNCVYSTYATDESCIYETWEGLECIGYTPHQPWGCRNLGGGVYWFYGPSGGCTHTGWIPEYY